MIFIVNRYKLDKTFILSGQLKIEEMNHSTTLTYTDNEVNVTATNLYHPLLALERLRKELETEHDSIIGINGCRVDTAYRATGGYGTYIIEQSKPATKSLNLFEPTTDLDKLCTVDEHEAAYNNWINSVMSKK